MNITQLTEAQEQAVAQVKRERLELARYRKVLPLMTAFEANWLNLSITETFETFGAITPFGITLELLRRIAEAEECNGELDILLESVPEGVEVS